MRRNRIRSCVALLAMLISLSVACLAAQMKAQDLRLIPFPKKVVLTKGVLKINPQTQIATSGMSEATRAGLDLKQELERAGLAVCNFFYVGAVEEDHKWVLSMSAVISASACTCAEVI